jgi:hypothetical protein
MGLIGGSAKFGKEGWNDGDAASLRPRSDAALRERGGSSNNGRDHTRTTPGHDTDGYVTSNRTAPAVGGYGLGESCE